jgi:hypothetical protein
MKVTKLNVQEGSAEAVYTETRNGLDLDVTAHVPEGPHPDLLTPWKATRKFFLELLGFTVGENGDAGEDPQEWELRAMRFKHADDTLGVSVTLMRKMPSHTSALLINTPEWKMKPEGEDELFPVELRRHLRVILEEAEALCTGKTAQEQLKLEGGSNG